MNFYTKNQEVLKRILRAIELATKYPKFALYFIQCELLTDQNNYINSLKEQCNEKGVELLKVDLSHKIIKNLREEILNELNEKFPNGKPDELTIAVTGLETPILTDVNEESPAILQILNMGREHYARDLPYPSMFWLPGYAITKIASVAPDFWSWRGGGVDKLVSSEEAIRQTINEAIRSREPTDWDEGIDQIILFERLIEGHPGSENGTAEQKSEYRKLQYRLGAAYHSLEKYPRAYQHYRRALEIGRLSSDFVQGKELNALGLVCRELGKLQKSNYSYLFSIAINTDTGLEDDLNKGIISEKLKNIFKINRYPFFDNATVTKDKEDEWVITDEEKFIVRKEDGKLNIYKKFLEDSLNYFRRYLTLCEKMGDRQGQGVALGHIGLVYRDMQQNETAIEYFERALSINKRMRNRSGESDNLGNLGLAYQEMDNFEQAIKYHLEALEVSKKIPDGEKEIKDLSNLGCAFYSQGDIKDAIGYSQQALKLSRKHKDRTSERDILIKIATYFREQNELDAAREYYKKAVDTCREIGDDRNLCDVLIYLAELSHEFEETEEEIDFYERALDLSRKLRDEEKELRCLRKLIQRHHRQWDTDKAKRYIDEARKLLGNNLKLKKINVWLKDGSDRQPKSLVDRKYYLCLNIGEPDPRYSPLSQTDFIYDLACERDSNKQIKGIEKISRAGLEEREQILRPTPETYGGEEKTIVEEKTIKVAETSRPKTRLPIDETQPTSLTTDQQLREEPSDLTHEEFSDERVTVSVRLQDSRAFEFDKIEKRLSASWEKDSETIYFRITPKEIGKQSITVEGAANDIPFDLNINVDVKKAVVIVDTTIKNINQTKDKYAEKIKASRNLSKIEELLLSMWKIDGKAARELLNETMDTIAEKIRASRNLSKIEELLLSMQKIDGTAARELLNETKETYVKKIKASTDLRAIGKLLYRVRWIDKGTAIELLNEAKETYVKKIKASIDLVAIGELLYEVRWIDEGTAIELLHETTDTIAEKISASTDIRVIGSLFYYVGKTDSEAARELLNETTDTIAEKIRTSNDLKAIIDLLDIVDWIDKGTAREILHETKAPLAELMSLSTDPWAISVWLDQMGRIDEETTRELLNRTKATIAEKISAITNIRVIGKLLHSVRGIDEGTARELLNKTKDTFAEKIIANTSPYEIRELLDSVRGLDEETAKLLEKETKFKSKILYPNGRDILK